MAYATKEKRNAAAAKWRAANREKCRAATRRSAAKNAEGERARWLRWSTANVRDRDPIANRAAARAWAEAHPDRIAARAALRRARKAGALVERVVPKIVFERDGNVCQLCGQPTIGVYPDPLSPSLDHIVPLAKGGAHSYDNTQCAHLICNTRKGARTPEAETSEAVFPTERAET